MSFDFGKIIEKFGKPVVLCMESEEYPIKAFINPIITNRSDKTWNTITPVGEVDKARYYYFGPADHPITDYGSTRILMDGRIYEFVRAELFTVEGVATHCEGVLRIREEFLDE